MPETLAILTTRPDFRSIIWRGDCLGERNKTDHIGFKLTPQIVDGQTVIHRPDQRVTGVVDQHINPARPGKKASATQASMDC